MAAADVVGVLLGDLLDVDAAHVAEQHQRLLGGAVPDDARVVLLLDLGLRVDEHAARHVAADLQLQDVARVGLGFLGRVGELDAAGLHPPAGEHLRLDHGRPADPRGDRGRLGGIGREAVVGDGDAGALDDLARLELEESHRLPHAARKPIGTAARVLMATVPARVLSVLVRCCARADACYITGIVS